MAVSATYDPPRPWIRSYADGVPEDLGEMTGSLVDIVAESARSHPDAPALEFFGRTTSYRELEEQISRAAAGLAELGVTAGDPVAIVLPNCPQHIVAFYAVMRLGAIAVEHNPLYTAAELRHQFEDHGAKVAVVWDKTVETVRSLPGDVAVESIISVDITRSMPLPMRTALRLPVRRLRQQRAALTAPASGATDWPGARPQGRGHSAGFSPWIATRSASMAWPAASWGLVSRRSTR